MRRFFAGLTSVAVLVTATGFGDLCFCHALDAEAAEANEAEDEHSCCAGAQAEAPPEDADLVSGVCERGCCAPGVTLAQDLPSERRTTIAPPTVIAVVGATTGVGTREDAAHADLPPLRGPPPRAVQTRLAQLQSWLC